MNTLLLQTFLLLLASYFLGAFLACLAKRMIVGLRTAEPARVAVAPVEYPVPPPVATASPPPSPRVPPPVRPPITPVMPRSIEPVQPRIDVLRRPEPRATPKLVDPKRFERALMGPDPNEGIPRIAIVEIRPRVLASPTVAEEPRPMEPVVGAVEPPAPPPPPPPPIVETPADPPSEAPVAADPPKPEEAQPRRSMLSDATTSAAAGAVAVAKAAAAASMAIFTRGGPAQAKATAEKPAEPAPSDTVSEEPASEAKSPVQAKPVEKPAVPKKAPINGGDDLQRIRAIDAETERQLKELGVNYFEHIAAWTSPDVKRISQALKIPGRIDREQWVEQAQILAKGGETYYSRNRLAAQKAQAEEPASTEASDEHEADEHEADEAAVETPVSPAPDVTEAEESEASEPAPVSAPEPKPTQLSGMDAVRQGRSVAEMASAAAAAIAAASASVTRGLKPIEPISPLSRVDPKISIPAKLSDAIKERVAASTSQFDKEEAEPEKFEQKPIAGGNGPADDLKRIRGIGVLIEKRLNAMGVTRYEHVANWTSGDIDRISQVLEFRGRIERESWVEQARILSSGGQTEFSRRVDRGEFDTSRET